MFKIILLFTSLVLSSYSFSVSIEAREWNLEGNELSLHNIEISIHKGIVCGDANDIYISIPESFNGAAFSNSSLQLGERSNPQLYTDLTHVQVESTIYGEEPFSGITFCINENLMDSATVLIFFNKGQLNTDIVLLRNLNELAK